MGWGTRVRLSGGRLAHYAGTVRDGTALLAHGDYAWAETLRPAPDDAEDCGRCARRLPGLEHSVTQAIEEGTARRCGCGLLTWWPGFECACATSSG
jgi:hypothetical protein